MTISKYIQSIQQEISTGKPYEEYAYLFEDYKKHLELMVEQNPRNVIAVCQLAAVFLELRQSTDDSIKVMEDTLCQFESELNDDEKVRLYTNLAFFYGENGNEDKQITSLKKAISLKHSTPNAYNALAVCLTTKDGSINAEGDFAVALPLFEQAARLSNEFRYHYNYAVALYAAGDIKKARKIFETLYHQDNGRVNAAYGLGVCSYYLGDKKTALDIATLLAKYDKDDEVSEFQVADLFFLCGDYANHNAMFDNCKYHYYYDVSWLAPYFYCLKVLGQDDALMEKYEEVAISKAENIDAAKIEELNGNYTKEDCTEYVTKLQKELVDIKEAYQKIEKKDYKPEISPKLDFAYGCYLVDCPRHQHTS